MVGHLVSHAVPLKELGRDLVRFARGEVASTDGSAPATVADGRPFAVVTMVTLVEYIR